MALLRWQPLRELDTLQHEMNRLFDTLSPQGLLKEGDGWPSFMPPAEITETPEALHLKVEIPGLQAEDINVEVTRDSVSLSGERRSETRAEEKGVTRTEFRYGKFERVIPLPSKVDNTQVTAEYKDGILTLTLPKAEEEKNRVVKVNLG
ncbi:Hsp20/alpha crystallin family protein [Synechocystis sp. LKSZ1]|uniref:Hsp20/alpha crystallin family protein n=1 Tax=Synechocystis sp. LKSZ1 TaxID=3144951 RepID=UPI00336C19EE